LNKTRIVVAVVAVLGALAAAPVEARAQGGCILGICLSPPPASPAPPQPSPPACTALGTVDRNPTNARVAPRLGQALLASRQDGSIPFGFNDYAVWDSSPRATLQEDMALHRRVGSSILRIALEWTTIERDRGVDRWEAADRVYCGMVEAGIKPLFVVWTSPAWAVSDNRLCSRSPCWWPPHPNYLPDLERFAERAAIRYPAAVFEAWNEPNLQRYWSHPPNPARYVSVLRAIYKGIKNGNPGAVVLGGALSNNQGDQPDKISMRTFLRGMYTAGAGAHMDGVSFHPYPVYPDPQREVGTRSFAQVQEVVNEVGEGTRRRLVASELGASTTGQGAFDFSEAQQSQSLAGLYDVANAKPNVDAIVFHTLIEPYPVNEMGFGWVHRKDWQRRGAFSPKQVYCDFAARFATPLNCASNIPLG
jgi:polysaccharide biosynthesis protein PslG